jgi:hypothetical protein
VAFNHVRNSTLAPAAVVSKLRLVIDQHQTLALLAAVSAEQCGSNSIGECPRIVGRSLVCVGNDGHV